MLKNMKVGTKLLAVLAAPVLLLVILASIGVRQRLDTASSAQRVEQMAEMAATSAKLSHELQSEGVLSAAYMSSGGTQWKAELEQQKAVTDQAMATYKSALKRINPSSDSESIKKASSAIDDRLAGLDTQRRSVIGIESDTATILEQYVGTSSLASSLSSLNTAIAQATNDPVLARGLTTFANLNRLKAAQADQAALTAALTQVGFFPKTWPTLTKPATACENVVAGCPVFPALAAVATNVKQLETVYNDAADAPQKQLYRDSNANKELAGFEKQVLDTGASAFAASLGPSAAVKLNAGNSVVAGSNALGTVYSPRMAINSTTGQFTPLDPAAVVKASDEELSALASNESTIVTSVLDKAKAVRTDAQQAALLFVVGTFGAIAIALIIAFYVARAVTVPLKKLTSAAYTLSTDKLPALVERLRNPDEAAGSLSETLTPIDIRSKDEIGQLADAFNSIQQVTVEVAEEQGALLRKGIGDIFINLARRNQTLLDRQIEFIDQLEANEEDPDQLDNLFKLDHLATRMRRNAESLLVLAGAEPPRRRGRPVALADVVRVAIGEVEDFARISLLALDDVTVGGNVAVDLAHLLSELMENATHFSPPDTSVEIVGHRSATGYTISVSDQGIGMSADQLSEANNQLARPPLVGLALSRSLGFIVIGRLSSRFGITVRMTPSSSGGVTALVTLPGDLVTVDGHLLSETPTDEAPADSMADELLAVPAETAREELEADLIVDEAFEEFEETLAQSDFEAQVAADELLANEVAEVELETEVADQVETEVIEEVEAGLVESATDDLVEEPGSYLDAVPEGDDFERGLQSLVSDELAPGPVERAPGQTPAEPGAALSESDSVPGAFGSSTAPAEAITPVEAATQAEVAPVVTEPAEAAAPAPVEAKAEVIPPLTAAGLVQRTPKKRSEEATGGGMSVLAARTTGASQRSPEEVRKMLSRYRSGLNKGRGDADGSSTDSPES
jgi:signal transduction histidine kinase